MKFSSVLACVSLLLISAGCATVDSRVKDHQSAFSSWPPAIQENVRAGKVDIGYTQEMVEVALGKPDRLASRTTDHGQSDVWIYFDKGPHFSIGLGFGSGNRSSAVGGGVTVGDDFRDDEKLRVVFEGGRVTAIETRK
ncbi:MAG: hypothetical protein ABIZ04_01845 [Opitutus sp.]